MSARMLSTMLAMSSGAAVLTGLLGAVFGTRGHGHGGCVGRFVLGSVFDFVFYSVWGFLSNDGHFCGLWLGRGLPGRVGGRSGRGVAGFANSAPTGPGGSGGGDNLRFRAGAFEV